MLMVSSRTLLSPLSLQLILQEIRKQYRWGEELRRQSYPHF